MSFCLSAEAHLGVQILFWILRKVNDVTGTLGILVTFKARLEGKLPVRKVRKCLL